MYEFQKYLVNYEGLLSTLMPTLRGISLLVHLYSERNKLITKFSNDCNLLYLRIANHILIYPILLTITENMFLYVFFFVHIFMNLYIYMYIFWHFELVSFCWFKEISSTFFVERNWLHLNLVAIAIFTVTLLTDIKKSQYTIQYFLGKLSKH